MTQNETILSHLKTGAPITPIYALNEYGIFRLASRISELRKAGHPIQADRIPLRSGKIVARYWMPA